MVPERPDPRQHVLIISHELVGEQMAGPGIRYYHLARVLARQFQVTLAIPAGPAPPALAGATVIAYAPGADEWLADLLPQVQAVLVPALWLARLPALLHAATPLVIDGYDPVLAETLALGLPGTADLQAAVGQAGHAGDLFLCASERQRDWWLGLLEASGRVNPRTFGHRAVSFCEMCPNMQETST